MNLQEHTQPAQLERYSFLWSQARLVIAALALFLGGVPPVFLIFPGLYTVVSPLLTLSWLVSGVAAGYLLYRWNVNHQVLFGGKAPLDTAAFFVSAVSGLNLGLVAIVGRNIGMSVASGRFVFIVVGVLYLAAAYHLHRRWNAFGKKFF